MSKTVMKLTSEERSKVNSLMYQMHMAQDKTWGEHAGTRVDLVRQAIEFIEDVAAKAYQDGFNASNNTSESAKREEYKNGHEHGYRDGYAEASKHAEERHEASIHQDHDVPAMFQGDDEKVLFVVQQVTDGNPGVNWFYGVFETVEEAAEALEQAISDEGAVGHWSIERVILGDYIEGGI